MACWLDINTLTEVSRRLREHGDKIVLTHGAFDLFHIGHATLLKESKKQGDQLIVGLDSDERISKYKLKGRPVIPLTERIKILLDNKNVDFVFAIDDNEISEKYFVKLYRGLRPTTVTCGKDFSYVNQFVKRNRFYGLSATGFNVIRHQYENVQSTTRIINKIRAVS